MQSESAWVCPLSSEVVFEALGFDVNAVFQVRIAEIVSTFPRCDEMVQLQLSRLVSTGSSLRLCVHKSRLGIPLNVKIATCIIS